MTEYIASAASWTFWMPPSCRCDFTVLPARYQTLKPLEMLKIHCIFGAISVLMKVLITISNGLLNLEDSSVFYQIREYCLETTDDDTMTAYMSF